MGISRRNFLKMSAAGGGLLLASDAKPGYAAPGGNLPPEAVGILYDATLCIGCKVCMVGCKKYNSVPGGALFQDGGGVPYEHQTPEKIWDAPTDLSSKTLNVIKVHRSGTALTKDSPENGYSFVKQHCMHCITPACVSACPVAALKKDPVNGAVFYEKDRCIGCRYCLIACPFQIPKLEWEKPLPQIRKCQLCRHRYDEGKYAACCEVCPTGASIFGKVVDLRKEAKRRLALKPGAESSFPLQTLGSPYRVVGKAGAYVNHAYGLREAGGTQYMLLAGVPLDLLGFSPDIPESDLSELTWKYISKIPAVMAVVLFAGAGSWYYTGRSDSKESDSKTKEGQP